MCGCSPRLSTNISTAAKGGTHAPCRSRWRVLILIKVFIGFRCECETRGVSHDAPSCRRSLQRSFDRPPLADGTVVRRGLCGDRATRALPERKRPTRNAQDASFYLRPVHFRPGLAANCRTYPPAELRDPRRWRASTAAGVHRRPPRPIPADDRNADCGLADP